jgi:molybdopterin-containing oxidoreductase family iron-sulfur binding subunit
MSEIKKQDNNGNVDRRDFLKLSMAGIAMTAAPSLIWRAALSGGPDNGHDGETASSEHQWAMVIDQAKCTGCGHCTLACRAHNDVPEDISWNRIIEDGEAGAFLPIPCMHCVQVCPVGATKSRPDGIVMMDYDRCIGCRYCEMACPYGSRAFNWEEFSEDNPAVPTWGQPEVPRRPRGVVEKCSFCYQRVDRGLEFGLTPGVDKAATPACVNACPNGARLFGDLNDPESPVSLALAQNPSFRLRVEMGTGPRVYYLPPRGEAAPDGEPAVCE